MEKALEIIHAFELQLRDAQGYCTDSECIQDLPGPQGVGLGGNNLIMIGLIWSMIALAMFFLRPKSLRSNPSSAGKPGPSSSRVIFSFIFNWFVQSNGKMVFKKKAFFVYDISARVSYNCIVFSLIFKQLFVLLLYFYILYFNNSHQVV